MKVTLAQIFCLILASMLSQTGDATPDRFAGFLHRSKVHSATLPNLAGNEKKFYEIIVAPLVTKCADITFSPGFCIFQRMQKAMLCKNAKKIAKLYTELNGIYKQKKKHLVGTTQEAIRSVVLNHDLKDLKEIYSDLLSWEVSRPIQDAIVGMSIGHDARDNLKKAFIETFEEIKQWKIAVTEKINEKRAKWDKKVTNSINEKRKEIAEHAKKVDQKGENGANQQQDPVKQEKEKKWEKHEAVLSKAKDWDTLERRQITFRFLCIGYEMGKLYNHTTEEEQHWAMEQFAANLFVYSMRVDRPDYMGEPEIEEIAEKWSIAGNAAPNHAAIVKPVPVA
jgi:hypothetical protein